MSPAAVLQRLAPLDEPWRRLQWVLPTSVLIWIAILIGFSFMLRERVSRPLVFKPIEARIVELPSEAEGLSGGSAAPAAPAARKEMSTHPATSSHPPVPPLRKARPRPAPPISPLGAKPSANEQPVSESSRTAPGEAGAGGDASRGGTGGGGRGSGSGGLQTTNAGAHALYAPPPEIPDELREEVFEAEAIAHLKVDYNGDLVVTLTKPTSNARLNRMLLETLRQWRFAPAIKDGIAVDSEFDIRIPIAVR